MLLDATTGVHKEDVEAVAESVFATMMGLKVRPADRPFPGQAGLLTAAVYLTGERDGAVCIHCTPREACQFAGRFMGLPPVETVDNDVRDVIGELANMIAGNLKCTLAAGIKVSVPSVTDGPGYSLRVCKGSMTYQGAFDSEGGQFWITLIEAN